MEQQLNLSRELQKTRKNFSLSSDLDEKLLFVYDGDRGSLVEIDWSDRSPKERELINVLDSETLKKRGFVHEDLPSRRCSLAQYHFDLIDRRYFEYRSGQRATELYKSNHSLPRTFYFTDPRATVIWRRIEFPRNSTLLELNGEDQRRTVSWHRLQASGRISLCRYAHQRSAKRPSSRSNRGCLRPEHITTR